MTDTVKPYRWLKQYNLKKARLEKTATGLSFSPQISLQIARGQKCDNPQPPDQIKVVRETAFFLRSRFAVYDGVEPPLRYHALQFYFFRLTISFIIAYPLAKYTCTYSR